MGKNKRKQPTAEEMLERPWCYYCERDFEDMLVLVNHQKAKHLKCSMCSRRLDTAGGLGVHMQQVHKETLYKIENAIEGRDSPSLEIFGMEGIPPNIEEAHRAKIIAEYGGLSKGPAANGQPSKKVKLESPEEMKRRLAEHKAKKAAAAAGLNSGTASPAVNTGSPHNGQAESQAQAAVPSATVFSGPVPHVQVPPSQVGPYQVLHNQAGSPSPITPSFAQSPSYPQSAFSPPPQYPPQQAYPQQYPPQPFQPQQYAPQPAFQPPSHPAPPYPPPAAGYGMPMAGPAPGFPGYGPPAAGQFGPPAQQFVPPHHTPHAHGRQQQGFSNGQPARPKEQSSAPPPARASALPPATGLPARPNFDAPNMSRSQLQELHSGQKSEIGPSVLRGEEHNRITPGAIDQLIAEGLADAKKRDAERVASQQPDAQTVESLNLIEAKETNATPSDEQQVQQLANAKGASESNALQTPAGDGRRSSNSKDKQEKASKSAAPRRLVFVVKDLETSPEEKMSRMSRYSFTPRKA